MKTHLMMLAAFGLMQTASADATAYFALDCRAGVRDCSPKGEVLDFDARWFDKGEVVRLTDNGTLIATGISGSHEWPSPDDGALHMLKLEIVSGEQVMNTETALFAKGGAAVACATVRFPLDSRSGAHDCSSEGVVLRYDAGWLGNGESARITDNGTPVATGISGSCVWCMEPDDVSTHVLMLEILSGGNVVGTETAEFTNAFTVEFNGGGGSGSMIASACLRNRIYSLPKCGFRNGGKRFAGWACSNGRRYDDGVLVFNLAEPGETVTMTAIWE